MLDDEDDENEDMAALTSLMASEPVEPGAEQPEEGAPGADPEMLVRDLKTKIAELEAALAAM